jgi:hypothetical protein
MFCQGYLYVRLRSMPTPGGNDLPIRPILTLGMSAMVNQFLGFGAEEVLSRRQARPHFRSTHSRGGPTSQMRARHGRQSYYDLRCER